MGIIESFFLYVIISIILHSLSCYFIKHGSAVMKFIVISTSVGLLFAAKLYMNYGLTAGAFAAITAYAFFCEIYIFVITLVMASISVSIMLRIYHGLNSISELKDLYSGKSMVERRFRRLEDINLIENIGDKICVTAKGVKIVKTFERLQFFFFKDHKIISTGD